ncbi:MBL fold metallo-hydrolase [Pikeienuella piscinae]|uniref:MBL fold metallo-hydrolase n=1 Tax=Pikeienuella piscinae TaxID=2748098 RepID=A0A7M3T6L0_9RHOB|nr:MBL fold metallo-hydrolase [Pikeienuella piscinae]QIE57641.1 MBL fold metallo-hydrolase [Pikeienuella piscinae]
MMRFLVALALLIAAPASASQCIQLAGAPAPKLWRAALAPGEVRIRYIGHAALRIETGQGRAAVTDFYGDAGTGPTPDAVTMNHAHATHWMRNPPAEIPYRLKGWSEGAEPVRHWVQIDDLLIRNVTTDIRAGAGWERDGNSIFIFEYEGLCIGHLGHLHHLPTDGHYAEIGRLDVVLAPVDGGYTMSVPDMITVLKRVRARVVIPMHIFSGYALERFLAGMADTFEIDARPGSEITLSATSMPDYPVIRVLTPERAPWAE